MSPTLNIKLFLLHITNHSSVTLFIICVYECLMNIYTKFYLSTMVNIYNFILLNMVCHLTLLKLHVQ